MSQREVQKAINEMNVKMAARDDDDVPGNALKLRREEGLRIIKQLLNIVYETGECSRDFTEVTATALKKKPKATKYKDHRTISFIAHTAKIAVKILGRQI
jgi:hypothetical protein